MALGLKSLRAPGLHIQRLSPLPPYSKSSQQLHEAVSLDAGQDGVAHLLAEHAAEQEDEQALSTQATALSGVSNCWGKTPLLHCVCWVTG
jgi:hypothetical protein